MAGVRVGWRIGLCFPMFVRGGSQHGELMVHVAFLVSVEKGFFRG